MSPGAGTPPLQQIAPASLQAKEKVNLAFLPFGAAFDPIRVES